MRDKDLVSDVVLQILEAIGRIERRSAGIGRPEDFEESEAGVDRLDAIAMMLIAIGESCKSLDKLTEGRLLSRHPSIDWKGVMGIRDILSHQYFDIDSELIFSACRKHIPILKDAFSVILSELSADGPISSNAVSETKED